MPKLCVNIDHVATIRNARRITEPDPLHAAMLCETAGAAGITFHLREDRRHITDRDARALREVVKGTLNMEMAATEEMLRIALEVHPDQVTLVPERREEITTEGGLDVRGNLATLTRMTGELRSSGIAVSMFINADEDQVNASRDCGASHVEFHTGRYCGLFDREHSRAMEQLAVLERECETATEIGLVINAGHGLNYRNVIPIARIHGMNELNIGHAIIGRAVFSGLDIAVRDMIALLGVD